MTANIDLARAICRSSCLTDRIIPDDVIAIGELGLSGECRAISNIEMRIHEAARLGFAKAIVPYRNIEKRKIEIEGIQLLPIKSIYEALAVMKNKEE